MSQCADLLNLLQSGPVTTLDAVRKFGVLRASERIRELEDMGFSIRHSMVNRFNRKGKVCRVAEYTLISEGKYPVLRERA